MTKICNVSDITPNTGVCALFNDKQVAIFRTFSDEYFAVDNFDPFSKANVLSRGIIRSTGDVKYIASPIYKQRFDLVTGACLDDDDVSLQAYTVAIENDEVYLSA